MLRSGLTVTHGMAWQARRRQEASGVSVRQALTDELYSKRPR